MVCKVFIDMARDSSRRPWNKENLVCHQANAFDDILGVSSTEYISVLQKYGDTATSSNMQHRLLSCLCSYLGIESRTILISGPSSSTLHNGRQMNDCCQASDSERASNMEAWISFNERVANACPLDGS